MSWKVENKCKFRNEHKIWVYEILYSVFPSISPSFLDSSDLVGDVCAASSTAEKAGFGELTSLLGSSATLLAAVLVIIGADTNGGWLVVSEGLGARIVRPEVAKVAPFGRIIRPDGTRILLDADAVVVTEVPWDWSITLVVPFADRRFGWFAAVAAATAAATNADVSVVAPDGASGAVGGNGFGNPLFDVRARLFANHFLTWNYQIKPFNWIPPTQRLVWYCTNPVYFKITIILQNLRLADSRPAIPDQNRAGSIALEKPKM